MLPPRSVFLVDGPVMEMRTVRMVLMRGQLTVVLEYVVHLSLAVLMKWANVFLSPGLVIIMMTVLMAQMRRIARRLKNVRLEGFLVLMESAHRMPGNVMAMMTVEMAVMRWVVIQLPVPRIRLSVAQDLVFLSCGLVTEMPVKL